jgi:hypothetical protein
MQLLVKILDGTYVIDYPGSKTLAELSAYLHSKFPWLNSASCFLGSPLDQNRLLQDLNPFQLSLSVRLPGGKGGFGSQLKAKGARMSNATSTNFESSRDLSGRRLRTVHDAQKLAEYIRNEPARALERENRIQKKIKDGLAKPDPIKVVIQDKSFEKDHSDAMQGISNALAKGFVKKPPKKPVNVTAWYLIFI